MILSIDESFWQNSTPIYNETFFTLLFHPHQEVVKLDIGLKFNIQKMKIMASSPITSW